MLKLKQKFIINVKNYNNISSDENTDDEYDRNYVTNIESNESSIHNNCIDIYRENNENDYENNTKINNESENKTLKLGEKFCDFKVIVNNFGENSERFIGNYNGFETKQFEFKSIPKCSSDNNIEVNNVLEEVIECQNLNQIENILMKKTRKKKTKKKKKLRTNKELKPKVKESIDEKSINNEFETIYKAFNVNKTQEEENSLKFKNNFDTNMSELEMEGIEVNNGINGEQFKCLLCDKTYIDVENAVFHIQSFRHLKIKFGDYLRGTDAMFTIDSENIGGVEFAIARKMELRKINNYTKELFIKHGIRLKDGIGSNAYICLKCNVSFELLSEVKKHFKQFNHSLNKSRIDSNDKILVNTKLHSNNSSNGYEEWFKNEGIFKLDNNYYSYDREEKFFCQFCNIYFDCEETVVLHLNDLSHKKTKFGENLIPTDSRFTVKSDRINEFEVAFARNNLLKSMTNQTKSNLYLEGIRLKDGIGFNAFICNKCKLSIPSINEIEKHIKSDSHSNIINTLIDI